MHWIETRGTQPGPMLVTYPILMSYQRVTSTLLIQPVRLKFEIEGHFKDNLL